MAKKRKPNPTRGQIHQKQALDKRQLVRGVLKHPFDVSMATLIVLCDVDKTIAKMLDVQAFMASLTPAEQDYAAALEVALAANKVNKTRMQEALDVYADETGIVVAMGDAGLDEGFTAWLPGYNEKLQAKWREDNPEAAAAYDAQVAAQATMDQGVGVLQATDPQGDVSSLVPVIDIPLSESDPVADSEGMPRFPSNENHLLHD